MLNSDSDPLGGTFVASVVRVLVVGVLAGLLLALVVTLGGT
jgi:hypothetical protein